MQRATRHVLGHDVVHQLHIPLVASSFSRRAMPPHGRDELFLSHRATRAFCAMVSFFAAVGATVTRVSRDCATHPCRSTFCRHSSLRETGSCHRGACSPAGRMPAPPTFCRLPLHLDRRRAWRHQRGCFHRSKTCGSLFQHHLAWSARMRPYAVILATASFQQR